jgi:hypothetical protein
VDEFGVTRAARIGLGDDDLAEARLVAETWRPGVGFPYRSTRSYYAGLLNGAAAHYSVNGLRLLAMRATRLARVAMRDGDVAESWRQFDLLNGTAQ